MKLSIINGSPRGLSSNSTKILNWVKTGIDINYLSRVKHQDEILEKIVLSDSLLICFPLYVDSMPAQQKLFFEKMEKKRDMFKGKSISFIIHSGFPEMKQSLSLKEYLEFFSTDIMEMNLLGVVILAGSEALQLAPERMFQRQIAELQKIIECIEKNKPFPDDINIRINKRESLSWLQRIVFTINPFKNFYWNYRASKHDHKVRLKAKPY